MTLHAKSAMPDSQWFPFMRRWRGHIHNGSLKLCLIKYELDINVINFKTNDFQLMGLYLVKGTRAFPLQENIKINEFTELNTRKTTKSSTIFIR